MRKVVIIGAGSVIFCKTLVMDVLATPGMQDTHFELMDLNETKLLHTKQYLDQVIEKYNLTAKVHTTTDRREALIGADYVVCTIQVGGVKAFKADIEIPLKYGVDQCIGDTVGPGGIFRGLRTIPVMAEIARDIKELCPDALLLNYTNPMSAVCWAVAEEGINVVGLCHGVQITMDLISSYVGIPKDEIDFINAGINHMAWFIKLEHKGEDIYLILRRRFEEPEYFNEKVRGEMFRQFGYFMTESTGHLSEYLPYFRKNKCALEMYCDEPDFGGETGAALKQGLHISGKYKDRNLFENEDIEIPSRSIEYGSYIIEAIELGRPFTFNGNMRNNGMIANLPDDCCAEMPILADGSGLHQIYVGNLPDHLAALNRTNINVHRLVVRAALSGDPEEIVHALALDPLTSAVLTLKEIREMAIEMLEASRQWLPQYMGRTIHDTPAVVIPSDVKRAEVPVDPALAISVRMTKLDS